METALPLDQSVATSGRSCRKVSITATSWRAPRQRSEYPRNRSEPPIASSSSAARSTHGVTHDVDSSEISTDDLGAVGLYVTKFTFCSRDGCALRVPLRTRDDAHALRGRQVGLRERVV